jgi:uracil-DNA glycosylase
MIKNGSDNAQILFILDCPDYQGQYSGILMSDFSGNRYKQFMMSAGIFTENIKIISLVNRYYSMGDIRMVPTTDIVSAFDDLNWYIAKMLNLRVLVPMGNYSLFCLTGKGKVKADLRKFYGRDVSASEAEKKADLSKLRGSIYPYISNDGRKLKILPILSPGSLNANEKWVKRTVFDFQKLSRHLKFSGILDLKRNHFINPTESHVSVYTKMVERDWKDLILAPDIETSGKNMTCIGFAHQLDASITIPTSTEREKRVFLPYVKRICESGAPKVLCNGLYDAYWLYYYGIALNNYVYDVQYMHHAIDPLDNHSLDYLASIYLDHCQYWKDEAKDKDKIKKYARQLDALWVYNGLDCCITRELYIPLLRHLEQVDMVQFYLEHYAEMIPVLLKTSLHGMKVDIEAQKEWAASLRVSMAEMRTKLEEIAGENLFSTWFSPSIRKATPVEIMDLLKPEYFTANYENESDIPKSKWIDPEKVKTWKALTGNTYVKSGKNAGMVKYREEIDGKSFSPAKLSKLFHETLGLPGVKKRRKGKRESTNSLDEASIRKLMDKYPKKAGKAGTYLLEYRSMQKELDYFKPGVIDPDGRIRFGYGFLTTAGRLRSAKNPRGTGMNGQNIKR